MDTVLEKMGCWQHFVLYLKPGTVNDSRRGGLGSSQSPSKSVTSARQHLDSPTEPQNKANRLQNFFVGALEFTLDTADPAALWASSGVCFGAYLHERRDSSPQHSSTNAFSYRFDFIDILTSWSDTGQLQETVVVLDGHRYRAWGANAEISVFVQMPAVNGDNRIQ